MNYSLIANSGIQFFSKEIEIDLNDGFKQVFYEWFDEDQVEQVLEYAYEVKQLNEFVRMSDMLKYGFIDHSGNLLVEPFIKHLFKSIVQVQLYFLREELNTRIGNQ